MKRSLLSLFAAALFGQVGMQRPTFFRGATPSRRVRSKADYHDRFTGCDQSSKDDGKPRGYPGAKLARKAADCKLGLRHA